MIIGDLGGGTPKEHKSKKNKLPFTRCGVAGRSRSLGDPLRVMPSTGSSQPALLCGPLQCEQGTALSTWHQGGAIPAALPSLS